MSLLSSALSDVDRAASLEKIRRRMGKSSTKSPSNIPSDTSKKRKHAKDALDEVFHHIEKNQQKYIGVLAEAVAIPGVSADPERRSEVIRTVKFTENSYN